MGCGFLADGAAGGEKGRRRPLSPTNEFIIIIRSGCVITEEVAAAAAAAAGVAPPPAEWTTLKLAPDSTILYLSLDLFYLALFAFFLIRSSRISEKWLPGCENHDRPPVLFLPLPPPQPSGCVFDWV